MSSLHLTQLTVPTAPLGPDSPLPPLAPTPELHAGLDLEDADEEMRHNIGYGRVDTVLPYLRQDDYGRELTTTSHPAVVLENDALRATFLPSWGGRLWSLLDRTDGRELLYRNPALQPANLALRGAWFAGGVEWNIGMIGHTPLTCEPLHSARLQLPDGTQVLRMYEYERIRGVVYQVDAWLPDQSAVLLVAIRITNPNPVETPMYWWSNTAVPETAETRVLVDASAAWTFDFGSGLRHGPLAPDSGYPARAESAGEYFYDLRDRGRPWIAAVDADGVGLVQSSTRELRGRKQFFWGRGSGGRHWQEWLSPEGSCYLEIQAGLARTQLEHVPMPAESKWSWVEAYGRIDLDPGQAHADWTSAVGAAADWLEQHRPGALHDDWMAQAAAFADQPPDEMLTAGPGWGALESRRRDRDGEPGLASPGTPFSGSNLGPLQLPWLDLLDGREPLGDTATPPRSYQVSGPWMAYLERADGWYAALLLGVARAATGDVAGAVAAWEDSLVQQPTAWAWRNIGTVGRADPARALQAYAKALELAPDHDALQVERLQLLEAGDDPTEVLAAVDALPESLRTLPAVRLAEARASVRAGELDRASGLLEPGLVLPQLREGEAALDELWVDYQALRLAVAEGRPVDDELRQRAQRQPLPKAYDFRMKP